ncbi:MAG: hypothetical protein LQ339_000197 [Xanthoria mediterranea]|nr:MAG: hypothetical protein LQ339_000197 [Xanthoria mediterranea]
MFPTGTRGQPDDASSANEMFMINNTTADGCTTKPPLPSAVDASKDKLLIRSTRPTVLKFPYHARLSQMGIMATEWESFTSVIASAATLSGAQKAKAITAAIGTGVVVNPWLGVVVGMWVWRREVKGLVLAGGKERGVGMVLGEWNRVWEGRGVRVGEEGADVSGAAAAKGGVVASFKSAEDVDSAEDAANPGAVGGEGSAVAAEVVAHGDSRLSAMDVDNAEDVARRSGTDAVGRIEGNKRLDTLEKGFAALTVDSVDGRKE